LPKMGGVTCIGGPPQLELSPRPTTVATAKGDPRSTAGRPGDKSRLFGQVATPPEVALRMVRRLFEGRSQAAAKILDPCVGRHTFPSAMVAADFLREGDRITSLDIDQEMTSSTADWAARHAVRLDALLTDFLDCEMDEPYDYAILN